MKKSSCAPSAFASSTCANRTQLPSLSLTHTLHFHFILFYIQYILNSFPYLFLPLRSQSIHFSSFFLSSLFSWTSKYNADFTDDQEVRICCFILKNFRYTLFLSPPISLLQSLSLSLFLSLSLSLCPNLSPLYLKLLFSLLFFSLLFWV